MISDVYFPRVNGVSTSIKTFIKELEIKGHQVTLVAPRYHDNDAGHDGGFGRVIRIPSRRVPFDPEDRVMRKRSIMKLLPELATEQFDIVHIHTPFVAHYAGAKLARLLRLPVVETYHTHFEEYLHYYLRFIPRRWLQFATRKFSRSQSRAVDAMIVPSELMRELLFDYGLNLPLRILPTGLDAKFFNQGYGDLFKQSRDIDTKRPILCHVGRAAHEKNIDFLIDMLAVVRQKLPDILLILAGEGPALKHLQQKVQREGLQDNVMFVGYLDRETELKDCYSAGDVFVFASRTETQGLVLLEAMAQGVPVVSTAVLGTVDILKPEKGALVAQEDDADFSGKVIELLTNKKLMAIKQDEALDYAQTWSAPEMAAQLVDWYGKVLVTYREGYEAV